MKNLYFLIKTDAILSTIQLTLLPDIIQLLSILKATLVRTLCCTDGSKVEETLEQITKHVLISFMHIKNWIKLVKNPVS